MSEPDSRDRSDPSGSDLDSKRRKRDLRSIGKRRLQKSDRQKSARKKQEKVAQYSIAEIKSHLEQIETYIKNDYWPEGSPPPGIPPSEPSMELDYRVMMHLITLLKAAVGDTVKPVKKLSIKEFRSFGYLQEVNRRFLHPLGLALEVMVQDNGNEFISGVWDYREDPEGIRYADGTISGEKEINVQKSFEERSVERRKLLGYVIQPVDSRPAVNSGETGCCG